MNPQSEKKMANGDRLAETMTKREAFALAAMQGLCSDRHHSDTQGNPDAIAAISLWVADALLAELEKRNG